MHFAKDRSKDCKNSYTKEELSFLKKESKRRSDEKSKEKKKLNYDSAKRADRYQKVKEKIAKKYDSLQRAEKYKSDKENNKRIKGKPKYNAIKRAERYQQQKNKKNYDAEKSRKQYEKFRNEKNSAKGKEFRRILDIPMENAWNELYDIFCKRVRKKIPKSIKDEEAIDTVHNIVNEKFFDKVDLPKIFNKAFTEAFNSNYNPQFVQIYEKAYDNAMDCMFQDEDIISDEMWKDWKEEILDYSLSCHFVGLLQKKVKRLSKDLINGELFTICFKHLKKSVPDIDKKLFDVKI